MGRASNPSKAQSVRFTKGFSDLGTLTPKPADEGQPADVSPKGDQPFNLDKYRPRLDAIAVRAVAELNVKTSAYSDIGAEILDVLKDARAESSNWDDDRFDDCIKALNARYTVVADTRSTAPDACNWLKVHLAVKRLETLQVLGADRLAFGRYIILFGAAFEMDKENLALDVRPGWAEWLKLNIPNNLHQGDKAPALSVPALKNGIADHKVALFNFAPKMFKKYKPKADKPDEAPDDKPADPVNPLSQSTRPEGDDEAPDDDEAPEPTITVSAVNSFVAQADPVSRRETATAFAMALVQSKDVDAIMDAYNVLNQFVTALRAAQKASAPVAPVVSTVNA